MKIRALTSVVGKARVHSPKLCLVGGAVAVTGAIIMAHRAGRKVEETLDINKEHIDNIKSLKDAEEIEDENGEMIPYSDKDYKKDLKKAYVGCAWDFAKLYLPPIALGAGGILLFVGGHKILGKRLALMTAAYEGIKGSFQQYRNNVISFDGADQDRKYLYGLQSETSGELDKVNPETGEITTIKASKSKPLDVVKDVSLVASPYAVKLEDCSGFTKDPDYNVRYLASIQEIANLKLRNRGYLFLYEVYEALGVTEIITPQAAATSHLVGWVYGEGDSEVIFNMVLVPAKCGVKDNEVVTYKEIGLIDFNCIGTIVNKLVA